LRAQPTGKVYRLGYLSQPSRASVEQALRAFLRKLGELGWVDGQNLVIDYRWADGNTERLPELATELVRRKVDLIVAPAGTAALAAKHATSTIPIVTIFPADPVELGLVASLSRPGGNVTGTTYSTGSDFFRKQLQLLKEAVPGASRVAILGNRADPGWVVQEREVASAARALDIKLEREEARGPEEFDSAFAAMARARAQALVIAGSSTYIVHRTTLAERAVKGRLPTMTSYREYVESGSLMSYGVNMSDFIGRAAAYVDRILKGAKPADLPLEQPTKFELVVNLRTAKALGLLLPQPILQRADDLIS
jgi:putative ABC transport system substrate-binding protein